MKKILFATLVAATVSATAMADLSVSNGLMKLSHRFTRADIPAPKSTQSIVITPAIITAGGDTIEFNKFGIYGRRALIHHERTGSALPAPGLKAADLASEFTYTASVPFTAALNGARPAMRTVTYGCANCPKDTVWTDLGEPWLMPEIDIRPFIRYEVPAATPVKETALQGKAYVEFPVNSIRLLPDFRSNSGELAKIVAVIDSVKSDPDMTVTSVAIKGYASPEGSLANNERLAKGRTEALKAYVMDLYSFPSDFVKTTWEAEDWAGLRQAVEADSTLPDRDALLRIIDETSLGPDAREARMRADFPETYRTLLANVYPSLRHSDYRVAYTIRAFTSPDEILRIMAENPAKLSPDEFYLAAKSLGEDSPEFRALWQTACNVYPDNETAQINAAMASLAAADTDAARTHLDKAGSSQAANFARALLAIENEEWLTAAHMLQLAPDVDGAASLLEKVDEIRAIQY